MPFKPNEKAFPKAAKLFRAAAKAEAVTLSITSAQKAIKSTMEILREAITRETHEMIEMIE